MTSVHRSRLAGLVAAALAAAAGLVGLAAGPAAAELCSGSGVNVVVDFNGLGGGVRTGCDPNGAGRSADKVFPAAGFVLDYVTGSGFVCRVQSAPSGNACARTPPANAYWGLFWSDGKSGRWSYATTGVDGLHVPAGGYVGFSWQGSESKDPPSAAPVNAPAPTKTPTKKPTPTKAAKPTKKATATSTPTQGTAATTLPSAQASAAARASGSVAPTAPTASTSASAGPSAAADVTLEPSETASATADASAVFDQDLGPQDDPGGLPLWVPAAAILAVGAAAGGTVWWRRRPGPP